MQINTSQQDTPISGNAYTCFLLVLSRFRLFMAEYIILHHQYKWCLAPHQGLQIILLLQ
jgi:hypothetical protein